MIRFNKSSILILAIIFSMLLMVACSEVQEVQSQGDNLVEQSQEEASEVLSEDGHYTSPDELALFIHVFDRLPDNFINKSKAMELGWEAQKGNLWDVAPGMSIGGDRFGNRERLLPEEQGRQYYEADVNYKGGYRGSERLVYSNDGLVFYTGDHYETFELLYGED